MALRTKMIWFGAVAALAASTPACFDFGGYTEGESAAAGSSGTGTGGGNPGACANSCAGCCRGETCVPVPAQTPAGCGKNGDACAACDPGWACGAGSCVVDTGQCSPASCPTGCCWGNDCVPAASQDWNACGGQGQTCGACTPGALCSNANCLNTVWDPSARIRLLLGKVSVSCSSCSGLGDGAPDPYVCFTVRGATVCSSTCNESSSCDWGYEPVVENLVPSDFTDGGMEVYLGDEDTGSTNDWICSAFPVWSPFALSSGDYTIAPAACTGGEGYLEELRFRLQAM